MTTIGPLEDSYLTEKDLKSVADTLVYWVTLSNGNQDPLSEPGLPKLGTLHPIQRNAIAERYGIDRWIRPGIDCFVRVYYSSDGRFSFPHQNPTEVGSKRWSLQDTATTIQMPLLFERPVLKGCLGGSAQWTYQWSRADINLNVAMTTVQRTVIVASFTAADRNAILAQNNKLHSLDPNGQGSELFRFMGAQEEQLAKTGGGDGTTAGRWQITYRWTSDRGNAAPQPTSIPAQYAGSVVLPPPRLPYHNYQVFFPTGNFDPCNQSSTAEPQILSFPSYDTRPFAQGGDVNPTGAISLPGRPLDP